MFGWVLRHPVNVLVYKSPDTSMVLGNGEQEFKVGNAASGFVGPALFWG